MQERRLVYVIAFGVALGLSLNGLVTALAVILFDFLRG